MWPFSGKGVHADQRHVSDREWKAWLEQNKTNREETAKKVRSIWSENPSRTYWKPARASHRKAVAPHPDPMSRATRWPGEPTPGGK